jgi:hypothetical protein
MFETVVLLLVLCAPESSGVHDDARSVIMNARTTATMDKIVIIWVFHLFLDVIGDFVVHVQTDTHTRARAR